MVFSSNIFLFWFLPSVLILAFLFRKNVKIQNVILLSFSLVFYFWSGQYVYLIVVSIVFNWWLGKLIDKYRKKWILGLGVILNLSMLFYFKYLTFVIKNLNYIIDINLDLDIVLPVGISFYTFQAMSYLVDVYREPGSSQSLVNVALYISLFPQLIAGPIVRFSTINDQINDRTMSAAIFEVGVERFIKGLGKKVIWANGFATIADYVFELEYNSIDFGLAWIGAIAYTFQILFDFSGYSDMAIGLGKMFGFEFEENFKYPYSSKSITEFWRRWHISLGTWFRDYVYIPLGGNRVGQARLVFNLFVVWSLTGIWHGANWTFLVWGLLYFILLMVEKTFKLVPRLEKMKGISNIYTMFFVIIGWVFFRSDSITEALLYIRKMFSFDPISSEGIRLLLENKMIFLTALLLLFPMERIKSYIKERFVYKVILIAVLFISIACIIKGGYNPFIYFNF